MEKEKGSFLETVLKKEQKNFGLYTEIYINYVKKGLQLKYKFIIIVYIVTSSFTAFH